VTARHYLADGHWQDGRFWRRVDAAEGGTSRLTGWFADCSAANSEAFKSMANALDEISASRAGFEDYPLMFKRQ
jgi:hypothetical protein